MEDKFTGQCRLYISDLTLPFSELTASFACFQKSYNQTDWVILTTALDWFPSCSWRQWKRDGDVRCTTMSVCMRQPTIRNLSRTCQ